MNKENGIHLPSIHRKQSTCTHEVGKGESLRKHAASNATNRETIRKPSKTRRRHLRLKRKRTSDCRPWLTIQQPGTVSVWSPKEVDVIQRQSII